MKNKVIMLGVSTGGLVFAAPPVEDFDAGKVSVDVGTAVIPAVNIVATNGFDRSDEAKRKIVGGVTVGIGHKLAVQYRYDESQLLVDNDKYDLRDREYNLIY